LEFEFVKLEFQVKLEFRLELEFTKLEF